MESLLGIMKSGDYIGVMSLGIIFLLFMSGVMAIVFIKYIFKIMGNLENVEEIKPLIDKVQKLVEEIHNLVTSHEVTSRVTAVEIANIKKEIETISSKVEALEMDKSRSRERLHSLEGGQSQMLLYLKDKE